MKKSKLLPKLAFKGVIQNGTVYFPYFVACIFSVFTFFVFASIMDNDIVETLPHSAYAWMLLLLGKILLCIILLPFLFYANSFLIKRRKKEIGLYSLLGLEKKHIGIMLLLENLLIYVVSIVGGVLLGMVLSKLLFLLLLKLSGLPVVAEFTFTWNAFAQTLVYFAIVFLMNYINSLVQLSKSKPVELLSGSKKGEKEPRGVVIYAMLGAIALAWGYKLSICSKLDSMIFTDFFMAVLLVVVGTYLLFTSGSIFFLRLLKKRKGIYYKPANFITISGMLYRMKKNAASLSNICIFSTMVLITLICTLSVFFGKEEVAYFDYPYDVQLHYSEGSLNQTAMEEQVHLLEKQYGLKEQRIDFYNILKVGCGKLENDNRFQLKFEGQMSAENYKVFFMTLDDYNTLQGKNETLEENQVIVYTSGRDYGFETMDFMGMEAQVKAEETAMYPWPKAEDNTFSTEYVIVVKDRAERDRFLTVWAEKNGVEDMTAFLNSGSQVVSILTEGSDEAKTGFINELSTWAQMQTGFTSLDNGIDGRTMNISMQGGLLFIGIIFGLVFFMCLLLIMYYKQISEGYEDQSSFAIMQKVGLSDKEIKSTVHKQILMVFFIPLGASLLHTAAGMFMVKGLLGSLRFFNTLLLFKCCMVVSVLFLAVYGISYLMTAKTYYKIVR